MKPATVKYTRMGYFYEEEKSFPCVLTNSPTILDHKWSGHVSHLRDGEDLPTGFISKFKDVCR